MSESVEMEAEYFDLKIIGCKDFVTWKEYSGVSKQIWTIKLQLRIILELLWLRMSSQEFVSSTWIQDLSSVIAWINSEFNRTILSLIVENKEVFVTNMNYCTSTFQQAIDLFCDTDNE